MKPIEKQLYFLASAVMLMVLIATSANAGRILVDVGRSDGINGNDTPAGPDVNGNHWNNYSVSGGTVQASGFTLSNLIDDTGVATGVGLETFAVAGGGSFGANGLNHGGLAAAASHGDAKDPDPASFNAGSAQFGLRPAADYAIASVTGDYFFTASTSGAGIKVTGLDPANTYNFDFFGSRDTNSFRVTRYTATGVNSASQDLFTSGQNIGIDGAYDGNDRYVVNIDGISPTAGGEIELVISQGQFQGSGLGTFFYLGALGIHEVAVPEPTSAILLGMAGVVTVMTRRRC